MSSKLKFFQYCDLYASFFQTFNFLGDVKTNVGLDIVLWCCYCWVCFESFVLITSSYWSQLPHYRKLSNHNYFRLKSQKKSYVQSRASHSLKMLIRNKNVKVVLKMGDIFSTKSTVKKVYKLWPTFCEWRDYCVVIGPVNAYSFTHQ